MKEIEFSTSQFQFLAENFPDLNPVLNSRKAKLNEVIVSLKNEHIEYLLDGLSNLLSEKGVDKDSEPNEFGYFVESIIDPLSRAFYNPNIN